MAGGYKTEPVDEYGHILSNLQGVLSEAEEQFDTANIRMELTAKANKEEDLAKLNTEQVNWGLDYLRREDVVEPVGFQELGVRSNYNHDWSKNCYTDEELEEVIEELEY